VKIAMLLLAAGRGSRFGGPVPKAFLKLRGRPLLVASAERLLQALPDGANGELIVLVHPDDRETHVAACLSQLRALAGARAVLHVVDGGTTRQQSMANGLAAASGDVELVLVHDAARALLPVGATRACIETAAAAGAALLAVPAADTLKRVRGERVEATLDRRDVWLAQTPQVVRRELLARALAHAASTGFHATDDVSLVEHLGEPVAVVAGSATNLKITRADDLPLAEAILAAGLA
jgi:2-C-methyl-D-erythritol 4-phosphate cytidylyltransferase